jgi:hypothetical protein
MVHARPSEDVIALLTRTPRFRTLVRVLVATHLLDDLRTPGPWLLLAPPDAAFEAIPDAALRSLFVRSRVEALVDLAERHVARVTRPRRGGAFRSLIGDPIVIDAAGRLAGGGRIASWHPFDHGVLAVVDTVQWPASLRSGARGDTHCEARLQ